MGEGRNAARPLPLLKNVPAVPMEHKMPEHLDPSVLLLCLALLATLAYLAGPARRTLLRRNAELEDLLRARASELAATAGRSDDAEQGATLRDPLTGLWSHDRVMQILIEEISRSGRQGIPVSVAMVDLDHFTQVNDTHGRVVGDEVLKEVAHRLMRAIRTYDSVGRFGGERFVVVLAGADRRNAMGAAERIRNDISRDPIDTADGPLTVTASLGVVTRHTEVANDASALLVAADSALREAKEHGRDRVELAAAVG